MSLPIHKIRVMLIGFLSQPTMSKPVLKNISQQRVPATTRVPDTGKRIPIVEIIS